METPNNQNLELQKFGMSVSRHSYLTSKPSGSTMCQWPIHMLENLLAMFLKGLYSTARVVLFSSALLVAVCTSNDSSNLSSTLV
jgi:hypothetical protein